MVEAPLPVADGLKVKSGRTLADLRWLILDVESRLAVGSCWAETGRLFEAELEPGGLRNGSVLRGGKTKSGFGMSSTGPLLDSTCP